MVAPLSVDGATEAVAMMVAGAMVAVVIATEVRVAVAVAHLRERGTGDDGQWRWSIVGMEGVRAARTRRARKQWWREAMMEVVTERELGGKMDAVGSEAASWRMRGGERGGGLRGDGGCGGDNGGHDGSNGGRSSRGGEGAGGSGGENAGGRLGDGGDGDGSDMEDAVSVVEMARVQEAWRRRRKVVRSEAAVTVVVHKQYTTCTNHTPRAQPYTTHTQSY